MSDQGDKVQPVYGVQLNPPSLYRFASEEMGMTDEKIAELEKLVKKAGESNPAAQLIVDDYGTSFAESHLTTILAVARESRRRSGARFFIYPPLAEEDEE